MKPHYYRIFNYVTSLSRLSDLISIFTQSHNTVDSDVMKTLMKEPYKCLASHGYLLDHYFKTQDQNLSTGLHKYCVGFGPTNLQKWSNRSSPRVRLLFRPTQTNSEVKIRESLQSRPWPPTDIDIIITQ